MEMLHRFKDLQTSDTILYNIIYIYTIDMKIVYLKEGASNPENYNRNV